MRRPGPLPAPPPGASLVRALLLGLLLGSLLGLPRVGSAADGVEALVEEAEEANAEFCQELRAAQSGSVGDLLASLATVYGRVEKGYQRLDAPELLYWRGVLAMCMGLNDNAERDLLEFVQRYQQSPAYSALVLQSQTRLRRLGSNSTFIEGPSARWTARPTRLVIEGRYQGGSGLHLLACTDEDNQHLDVGQHMVENGPCLEQDSPAPQTAVAAVPLGFGFGLAHYFTAGLGLRVDVDGDVPLPLSQRATRANGDNNPALFPEHYRPQPRFSLSVGPALRTQTTATSALELNAAHYFIFQPALGIAFAPLQPMAGNAELAAEQGLLVGPLLGLLQLGVHLRWEGGLEVSQRLALALGGEVQLHAPMPGAAVPRLSQGRDVSLWVQDDADGDPATPDWRRSEESVRIDGELGLTTALQGSFWVRFLRPVGTAARSAVGPQLLVRFSEVSAGYGNDPADVWCLREGGGSCPAGLRRKVYSTLRLDAYVQVGVVVRFGGIEVVGKAEEVEQIKSIEVVPLPVVPRSQAP